MRTQRFDEPALYQIRVEGRIPASWADRLDGMRVTVISAAPPSYVSTLTGTLDDQAALAGVLNTLYALHLVVLSVTRIDTLH
ncbi:MAG: hypothetical protein U0452_11305 [Anaerolineae bacterium]